MHLKLKNALQGTETMGILVIMLSVRCVYIPYAFLYHSRLPVS